MPNLRMPLVIAEQKALMPDSIPIYPSDPDATMREFARFCA
jgi:hypothetical protein